MKIMSVDTKIMIKSQPDPIGPKNQLTITQNRLCDNPDAWIWQPWGMDVATLLIVNILNYFNEIPSLQKRGFSHKNHVVKYIRTKCIQKTNKLHYNCYLTHIF